jgi:hypothetical protein
MVDFSSLTAGLAVVKTGFDVLKSAISTAREAKELLPHSGEREALDIALNNASQKIAEGEAIVATALGYKLCRCAFPPTPMLLTGYVRISLLSSQDQAIVLENATKGGPVGVLYVHKCPKCGATDAPTYRSERL